MKVKLCWRTKENKAKNRFSSYSNSFTMKEIKHKVHPLIADENIVDVWVNHWDGWHWCCHKQYKKDGITIKRRSHNE